MLTNSASLLAFACGAFSARARTRESPATVASAQATIPTTRTDKQRLFDSIIPVFIT